MPTNIQGVYERFVRDRFPLPSEAQVASLEHRINVRFPPEYRRFLLEYNGGWFRDNDLILPIKESPLDELHCLYGIGADHESAELGRRSDMELFDDNDPPQIVIIGCTPGGYLIVLGVHPETYGDIFFKTFKDWIYLTHSLEEFFGMMVEPETE